MILALFSFQYLLEKGGSRTRKNFELMGGPEALEILQTLTVKEISDKCEEIIDNLFLFKDFDGYLI